MTKKSRNEQHKRRKQGGGEQTSLNVDEMIGLKDIVEQDIRTIVSLHMHTELKVSYHQRFLEKITSRLGHPKCFYLVILFITFWILVNILGTHIGLSIFDPAPFYWLQGIIGLNGFLMTVLVLIVQNRQGKISERWRQLDLQVGLLMEHKVSKVIALIEELRRDIPSVKDRYDPQAEAMEKSIDPSDVFTSLNENLEEATREVKQATLQTDIDMEIKTEFMHRPDEGDET